MQLYYQHTNQPSTRVVDCVAGHFLSLHATHVWVNHGTHLALYGDASQLHQPAAAHGTTRTQHVDPFQAAPSAALAAAVAAGTTPPLDLLFTAPLNGNVIYTRAVCDHAPPGGQPFSAAATAAASSTVSVPAALPGGRRGFQSAVSGGLLANAGRLVSLFLLFESGQYLVLRAAPASAELWRGAAGLPAAADLVTLTVVRSGTASFRRKAQRTSSSTILCAAHPTLPVVAVHKYYRLLSFVSVAAPEGVPWPGTVSGGDGADGHVSGGGGQPQKRPRRESGQAQPAPHLATGARLAPPAGVPLLPPPAEPATSGSTVQHERISEVDIVDMCFGHGTAGENAAGIAPLFLLHVDRRGRHHVVKVLFNIREQRLVNGGSSTAVQSDVESTATMLFPAGPHGVCVVGTHFVSFVSGVEPVRTVALSGVGVQSPPAAWTPIDATRFLLCSYEGTATMVAMSFTFAPFGATSSASSGPTSLTSSSVAGVPPAVCTAQSLDLHLVSRELPSTSSVAYAGNNLVFVGSSFSNSVVLSLLHGGIESIIENIGPVETLCVRNVDGRSTVVAATGGDNEGALCVLRSCVDVEVAAVLPEVEGVVSLSVAASLVVVGFFDATRVLAAAPDGNMDDVSATCGLRCDATTLACGAVSFGSGSRHGIVQVTPHAVLGVVVTTGPSGEVVSSLVSWRLDASFLDSLGATSGAGSRKNAEISSAAFDTACHALIPSESSAAPRRTTTTAAATTATLLAVAVGRAVAFVPVSAAFANPASATKGELLRTVPLPSEVACLSFAVSGGASTDRRELLIGLWRTFEIVRVGVTLDAAGNALRVSPLAAVLRLETMPRSIFLGVLSFGQPRALVVAFADGTVGFAHETTSVAETSSVVPAPTASNTLEGEDAHPATEGADADASVAEDRDDAVLVFSEPRFMSIGSKPIKLHPCRRRRLQPMTARGNDSSSTGVGAMDVGLICTGDNPAVLFESRGVLQVTGLGVRGLNAVCDFEGQQETLVMHTTNDELIVGTVADIRKMSRRRYPQGGAVHHVCYYETARCFVAVVAGLRTDVVRFFNATTMEPLAGMGGSVGGGALELAMLDNERVVAMVCATVGGPPAPSTLSTAMADATASTPVACAGATPRSGATALSPMFGAAGGSAAAATAAAAAAAAVVAGSSSSHGAAALTSGPALEVIVVGAAPLFAEEREPQQSRLALFRAVPTAEGTSNSSGGGSNFRIVQVGRDKELRGAVYSLCQAAGGRIVAGVSSHVELFSWNARDGVLVSEASVYVGLIVPVIRSLNGTHFFCGDVRHSVTVLTISPVDGSLEEVCRDVKQRQVMDLLVCGRNVLVADEACNVAALTSDVVFPPLALAPRATAAGAAGESTPVPPRGRRSGGGGEEGAAAPAADAPAAINDGTSNAAAGGGAQGWKAKRFEAAATWHLGDRINAFAEGTFAIAAPPAVVVAAAVSSSIAAGAVDASSARPAAQGKSGAPPSPTSSTEDAAAEAAAWARWWLTKNIRDTTAGAPQVVYGTATGAIGTITPINRHAFVFLSAVQTAVEDVSPPIGGLRAAGFREVSSPLMDDVSPARGFIDGDLVERFLLLPRGRQVSAAAAITRAVRATLDTVVTVDDVLRVLGEVARYH